MEEKRDTVTVEPMDNGCLRVWLTGTELEQWGLEQAKPPMGSVRRLVRRVCASAGWPASPPVTAELIPVEGGGVLLVSPRTMPENPPQIYALEEDALLDLWRQWRYIATKEAPTCAVYRWERGYHLVLYPGGAPEHFRCAAAEYGTLMGEGEGAAARCGEYGTLLWAGCLTEPAPPPPDPEGPEHQTAHCR